MEAFFIAVKIDFFEMNLLNPSHILCKVNELVTS